MASVRKNSKIDFYKLTTLPKVETTGKSKDAVRQRQLETGFRLQTLALNRLGTTVNSMGKSMQQLRDVQFAIFKTVDRQSKKDFKAVFNLPTVGGKGKEPGEKVQQERVKTNPWWADLMDLISMALGGLLAGAAFKWLSNEENRKKAKEALEKLFDILGVITNFFGTVAYHAIDGLWTLLCDKDASWLDKFGGFVKGFTALGLGLLGIRWLKNPLKILKDFKGAFRFFGKALRKTANKAVTSLKRAGVVALVAGAAWGAYEIFKGDGNEKDEGDDPTKEGAAKGGKLRGYKKGGRVLKGYAKGGFINGPQSGYPVSLDGGKSTAFIGHGLEYVAQKASGGFVVPISTPATKNNPGLMGSRMNEASRMGYDLSGMADGFAKGGRAVEQSADAAMREKGRKGKRSKSDEMLKGFASGGEMSKFDFAKHGKKYRHPGGDFARDGTCTTGVLHTAEKHGVVFGNRADYVTTGSDPNNPRGLMAQVIKKYGWGPAPGLGKSRSIRSPYGNVTSNSLTYAQWGKAVTTGKVPTGALVFSTKMGWDYSGGSSGNDSAIAQEGGKKLWSGYYQYDDTYQGKPIGSVYGPSSKEISVLVHPRGSSAGYDGDTGDGGGGGTTTSALTLTGYAKQRVDAMGGNAFLSKLDEMCKRLKCDTSDMLGKMASESGLLPNNDRNGNAIGLIQFIPSTWAGLGTGKPHSWLRTASGIEQLPYIEKFLKPTFAKAPKDARGMVSTGHVYVSTFLPAFAKDPEDTVIATRDGSGVPGFSAGEVRGWYEGNKGLDGYQPDGSTGTPDGKITIAELAGRISAKKKEYGISGGVTTGVASGPNSGNASTTGSVPKPPIVDPRKTFETMVGSLLGDKNPLSKSSAGSTDQSLKPKKSSTAGAGPSGKSASSSQDKTKDSVAAAGPASPVSSGDHTARQGSPAPAPAAAASPSNVSAASGTSSLGGGTSASAPTAPPSTGTASALTPASPSGSIMTTATQNMLESRNQKRSTTRAAIAAAMQYAEQTNQETARVAMEANKQLHAVSAAAGQRKEQLIPTSKGGNEPKLVSSLNSTFNVLKTF